MLCRNHALLWVQQHNAIAELLLRPLSLYALRPRRDPSSCRDILRCMHVRGSKSVLPSTFAEKWPATSPLQEHTIWRASFCPVRRLKGFPIPVYEQGTGACSGAPYNTSAYLPSAVSEYTEPLVPLKSLREWLTDLNQDGLVLASFIVALISGVF